MVWDEKEIEKITKRKLVKQLGKQKGKEKYARYTSAKSYLCENVYDQIQNHGSEGLTDHSAKHVSNVIDCAAKLMGDVKGDPVYTGIDCYCLLLAILFHDVGNIYGRDDHQNKIDEVYSAALNSTSKHRAEKILIKSIVGAHCGKDKEGNEIDTMAKLMKSGDSIDGYSVRTLDVAAVIRFADELAEGPQRTSDFVSEYCNMPESSTVYHEYAKTVEVHIDRNDERVILKYQVLVNVRNNDSDDAFKELIKFILARVEKVNDERRYNRFYTEWLQPFKKLEVTINLLTDDDYERKVSVIQFPPITDKVLPGSSKGSLASIYPKFEENTVLTGIENARNQYNQRGK